MYSKILHLYAFFFSDLSMNVDIESNTSNGNRNVGNVCVTTCKNYDLTQGNNHHTFDNVTFSNDTNIIDGIRNSEFDNSVTNPLEPQSSSNMIVENATFSIFTNEMHDNMDCNTYDIDNVTSDANEPNVNNSFTLETFTPLAESTFTRNQSITEHHTDSNIELNDPILSEHNTDDSFHLSDCSMSEDSDSDVETGNNTVNRTVNKTKDILNLTSSLCTSKGIICDDRDMHVETSGSIKSKLNMCPYCNKLQTQFTRHLEVVHKNEEDVKKCCFLPKG